MRKLALLAAMLAMALAVTASTAFAQQEARPGVAQNEIVGTEASEALYGTYVEDQIFGEGGHDLLVGEAGSDQVNGGRGDDYLVAAYGYWQVAPNAPASHDFVQGGFGDDLIDAADRAGAPDTVLCGPGSDLVYAGVEDFVSADCEFVYRYYGY